MTDQLNASVIKAILCDNTFDETLKKQIVTHLSSLAVKKQEIKANYNLATSAKAAGAAMLATPTGWIMLLTTALPLAITGLTKLYDILVETADEAREAADEFKSSYDEMTKSIEELTAELETNQERVRELQELSNAGTITFVEQDELERLKLTNAELRFMIENRKELAAADAKKANEAYVRSFEKAGFESVLKDQLNTEYEAIYEKYGEFVETYRNGLIESIPKGIS